MTSTQCTDASLFVKLLMSMYMYVFIRSAVEFCQVCFCLGLLLLLSFTVLILEYSWITSGVCNKFTISVSSSSPSLFILFIFYRCCCHIFNEGCSLPYRKQLFVLNTRKFYKTIFAFNLLQFAFQHRHFFFYFFCAKL